MTAQPRPKHRRSLRLSGYDYSRAGAYFVTICVQDRMCLFGEIVDGVMRLNEAGTIVRDEWLRTTIIRPNVELDAFVVMPNHLHGIIVLHDNRRGTLQRAPTIQDDPALHHAPTPQRPPTVERFGKPTSNSIPTIVRLFKSVTTKRINHLRGTPGRGTSPRAPTVWQRNYYEHIIRNEHSLNRIRQYITDNPLQWELDRENPVGARGNVPQPNDEPWHV